MKILLIGAGTIGGVIQEKLRSKHEVLTATRSSGDIQVDIASRASIQKLFQSIGKLDAVVVAGGKSAFQPIEKATDEDFQMSLNSKLMGQVNVVRTGLSYLNDGGSFTLTSGLLNFDPVPGGSVAALVDGAIEGFVMSVAIELPRGLRINCISPGIVAESVGKYPDMFPGFQQVSASAVADGYVKSILGKQTGRVYKIGWSS